MKTESGRPMIRRASTAAAVCVVLGAVAGCANPPAPPNADVIRVVTQLVDSEYAPSGAAPAPAGNALPVKVANIENFGCGLAPDQHGYLCQLQINLTRPVQGKRQFMRIVRMVKTRDGWRATME